MSTSINIPSFVRPEDLLLDLATKASEISSNEVASPLPPSDELSVTLAGSTKTTSTYEMSLPHEMGAGGVMQCEAHYGTSDEEEIPTSPCSSTAYKRITERYIRRCDETNRPFNRESSIDKSLKRKRTSEDELKGSEASTIILGNDENNPVPFAVHHRKIRKVLDQQFEETEDMGIYTSPKILKLAKRRNRSDRRLLKELMKHNKHEKKQLKKAAIYFRKHSCKESCRK